MKSDLEIIKACLKGKQLAYKALYERYKDYCFTICVRYGIPQQEVKDCMQVIFSQVFASLKKFDSSKAAFKTWFTQITINQILTRKRKRKLQYLALEDSEIEVLNLETAVQVDALMDYETIYHILSKMPPQYITVFNLYIIDGYSHKEIAKKLDIAENASRVLLHRGRAWAMKKLKFLKDETNVSIRNTH